MGPYSVLYHISGRQIDAEEQRSMGPLLTPTTELFYAFINVDDSPVPCDLPEVDVFSCAFKQATIAQPDFRKDDFTTLIEQESPPESPQDLVFDDFLSKDPNESGDTSPSSEGSSSLTPFPDTSKAVSNSSQQQQEAARNGPNSSLPTTFLNQNSAAISQNKFPTKYPNHQYDDATPNGRCAPKRKKLRSGGYSWRGTGWQHRSAGHGRRDRRIRWRTTWLYRRRSTRG